MHRHSHADLVLVGQLPPPASSHLLPLPRTSWLVLRPDSQHLATKFSILLFVVLDFRLIVMFLSISSLLVIILVYHIRPLYFCFISNFHLLIGLFSSLLISVVYSSLPTYCSLFSYLPLLHILLLFVSYPYPLSSAIPVSTSFVS